MGISFNPLTGQFDLTGAGGAVSWRGAVSTESSLPSSGNSDGDAVVTLDTDYIWVWDGTTSRWINQGVKSANAGAIPNSAGYSLGYSNVASNRREYQLTLQPADATNPGIISTDTQSIAGVKTFGSRVNADGGLDSTGASLLIGATTASTITIGRSGTTINMVGSTTYEQVTNLQVADKLITINKGGGSTTASGSGFELEENSAITGYIKTSSDRNSWQLLAPNTAGIITVTPGSSGFTIDQGSHNPVTIGTANGLSLSTQTLSLAAADGSNAGALTAGVQTIGGAKTFTGTISASNLSGTNTGDITLASVGSVPAAAGASLSSQILTLQPADATNPGVMTAAAQTFGGTKTFANIIDSGLTADTVIYANGSKQLTSSGVSSTTLSYLDATSSIQTQLNTKVTAVTGDIIPTSFTAADNQSAATNVTGLAFANGTVRSFEAILSVVRGSTYAQYKLYGLQEASNWELSQSFIGDSTGLVFTITSAGQIQYTSTSTGNTATVKFRAFTTSV
jgi:hypothetical protein